MCNMTKTFRAFLSSRDFVLVQGTLVSSSSTSGSLMYRTFWTVWERSTLLSSAVKQLTQLLLQAAMAVNVLLLSSGTHIYHPHNLDYFCDPL